MMKWSVCTVFIVLVVFGGTIIPAQVQAQANSLDRYIAERGMYNGKEIVRIIVPGRPPAIRLSVPAFVPAPNPSAGTNSLSNVPALDWSYGCSATSAAMMFGWYDAQSYSNMYAGPTNGGLFPLNNSVWGSGECPLSATHMGKDGLVTRGHVDDYWISYGSTADDPYITGGWTAHANADCTADYMGTNQSAFANSDGSTTFYNYTNGSRLYDFSAYEPSRRDGCHGLKLFAQSRGYTVSSNYSQYIYPNPVQTTITQGFTWTDYKAEIDAGRPVLIQVEGHTMLGYGYNDDGSNTMYIHDTWDYSAHSMVFGGSYSGMKHYGVTTLTLGSPGTVTATIDSVTPNPQAVGSSVQCVGHANTTYPATTITAYEWRAGATTIGTTATLTTSGLAAGDHTISFRAQTSEGVWSSWVFWTGNPLKIVSASVDAVVDSVTPNPVELGASVSFTGHGVCLPASSTVEEYEWESDLDGQIGTEASFSTDTLSEGDHTIRLRVKSDAGIWSDWTAWDGNPLRVIDTVVTASVDAVTPDPAEPGEVVHFAGSATSNWPGDTITEWEWRSNRDGTIGTTESFDKSDLSTGNHTIYLRAKSARDVWSAWVTSATNPLEITSHAVTPVIDSISPRVAAPGASIHFEAHGEDSFDHSISVYEWRSDVDGVIYSGPSDNFSTTSLSAGAHNISLRIQCADGKWSDWAYWSANPIGVLDHELTATIDSISPSAQYLGKTVHFEGHGTDNFEGYSIVAYEWKSSIDGVFAHTAVADDDGLSEGAHTISFRVQNDNGNWSAWTAWASNPLHVVNRQLTATILSVSPDPAEVSGTVHFEGSASDNWPGATFVAWQWDSNLDGTIAETAAFDTTELAAGEHYIHFRAQADDGTWTPWAAYSGNPLVVVHHVLTAVIDDVSPNLVEPGAAVHLAGHGNDTFPGHTISGYQWRSDIDGVFATTGTADYTGLSNGNHSISFRVQCSDGDWSAWVQWSGNPLRVADHDVAAVIDGITPNPQKTGAVVHFAGHGTDTFGHAIVAWQWESDIDGLIGTTSSFDKSNLTQGNHTIRFRVQCGDSDWSAWTDWTGNPLRIVEHTLTVDVTGPPACNSGAALHFGLTADDSMGHGLSYAWTALDSTGHPVGSFDDPASADPEWTAPMNYSDDNLVVTISLTVTCDGGLQKSDSLSLDVWPPAHAVDITAGPSGDANPCASGGAVVCSVTAADSRGHNLTYQWQAYNSAFALVGGFDDPTAANPTWTAPLNETDAIAEYTLVVTVECSSGLSTFAQYTQQVNSAPHEIQITQAARGAVNGIDSGFPVNCTVEGKCSRTGHGVTYAWTATDLSGTPAGAFDDPTAQNPIWTAPLTVSSQFQDFVLRATITCDTDSSVSTTSEYIQRVIRTSHALAFTEGPASGTNPCMPSTTVQFSAVATDTHAHHDITYAWTARDSAGAPVGAFDDATSQNPQWTAPANSSGMILQYTITCTATCSEGLTTVATFELQILSSHSRTFDAGLRMVGIPVVMAGQPTIESLLGGKCSWYDPLSSGYAQTGGATPHMVGRGYWVDFADEATYTFGGRTLTGPISYSVKDGWNMVSIPYAMNDGTSATMSAPTLAPGAWTYQGNGYELVLQVNTAQTVAHTAMYPWWGYWVLSYGDGTIHWDDTDTASAENVQTMQLGCADAEAGGWQIQIAAQSGMFVDACNYFGVAQADMAQILRIANPPIVSGTVDVCFTGGGSALASDIREISGGDMSWDFVVTSAADAPVTLSFPDLSAVPAHYRLVLHDEVTGKSVNMRTSRSYSYNGQGERNFRIEAVQGNGNVLAIGGVSAQQAGAGVAIAYTLSATADVAIEVRNISGRLITSIPCGTSSAGVNSTTWNLRNTSGATVPSGMYLCTITARADDGTQTSAVRTVNVLR